MRKRGKMIRKGKKKERKKERMKNGNYRSTNRNRSL